MPTLENIYPEYIHLDGGTQPRAEINQAVCNEYGEQMRAGEKFPPIDVYFDGKEYWLADGFHRHQAHVLARPGEAMECNVYPGTVQDAQWHSYGVNKTHGLRRTNEDKERAVRAALQHPNAVGKSNYEIADHCGVDEKTIRNYRRQLGATTEIPQSKHPPTTENPKSGGVHTGGHPVSGSRPRTGRDGRTINTAKIGKGKRRKAQKPRSSTEFLEARRNGYRGRMSSTVKLELPNNHVHNCAYDLLRHFTFEYLQKVFQEVVHIHEERLQKEKSE